MATVRILAFGLPRMLREIVEAALTAVPKVTLVSAPEHPPRGELAAQVRRHDAAFVIGDARALGSGEVGAALRAFPDLRVLALSHDGRRVCLYELRPHSEPLGEASAERLIAIVREYAIAPVTP